MASGGKCPFRHALANSTATDRMSTGVDESREYDGTEKSGECKRETGSVPSIGCPFHNAANADESRMVERISTNPSHIVTPSSVTCPFSDMAKVKDSNGESTCTRNESADVKPARGCPFGHSKPATSAPSSSSNTQANPPSTKPPACPFGFSASPTNADAATAQNPDAAEIHSGNHNVSATSSTPAFCPYGFSSSSRGSLQSAIGPLSCVLCTALLFDACRSVPCGHIFCRWDSAN